MGERKGQTEKLHLDMVGPAAAHSRNTSYKDRPQLNWLLPLVSVREL